MFDSVNLICIYNIAIRSYPICYKLIEHTFILPVIDEFRKLKGKFGHYRMF